MHDNHPRLVLVRSDRGDGGWTLHAPASDEEIAKGDFDLLGRRHRTDARRPLVAARRP